MTDADRALRQIVDAVRSVPDTELDGVVDEVLGGAADRCYGGGREGLVMRGLVMRLFHAGLDVHYVGDMTCPAVGTGGLVVLASRWSRLWPGWPCATAPACST
jgi:6-phospho-3-hexuloisomerase